MNKNTWIARKLLANPVTFVMPFALIYWVAQLAALGGSGWQVLSLIGTFVASVVAWALLFGTYEHHPTYGTSGAMGLTMMAAMILVATEAAMLIAGIGMSLFSGRVLEHNIATGFMTGFSWLCTSVVWSALRDTRSWDEGHAVIVEQMMMTLREQERVSAFSSAIDSVLRDLLSADLFLKVQLVDPAEFDAVMYGFDRLLGEAADHETCRVTLQRDGATGECTEHDRRATIFEIVLSIRNARLHAGTNAVLERRATAYLEVLFEVANELPTFFYRMKRVDVHEDGSLVFEMTPSSEIIVDDAERWVSTAQ